MSDDEFDNLPDDFADVQGVDWAQILAEPSTTRNVETAIPAELNSLSSSSYFSDDDEMDSVFLAELDRVEQRAVEVMQVAFPPQSRAATASELRHSRHFPVVSLRDSPTGDGHSALSIVPCKRGYSEDASKPTSPKGKGKLKAANDMQTILSGYEDELTCPICCDIFVASHVGNPCGHTFCGECGWQWHIENKNLGCPCCRQSLDQTNPMIPNIAMDNTVEKHVKALALSGIQAWEPLGRKHKEWSARKEAWRTGADKRKRKKNRLAQKKPVPFIPMGVIPVWFHGEDNVEVDPTYEDSDIELIPRPIRRARRRRTGGNGATG